MILFLLQKLKIKIGNIEVCKSKEIASTIKKSEDFLFNTVKNVTIAKKSYETFYNVVERNFYSTMSKLFMDERDKIKDDFLRENFGQKMLLQNWLVGFHFTFNMEDFQVYKN